MRHAIAVLTFLTQKIISTENKAVWIITFNNVKSNVCNLEIRWKLFMTFAASWILSWWLNFKWAWNVLFEKVWIILFTSCVAYEVYLRAEIFDWFLIEIYLSNEVEFNFCCWNFNWKLAFVMLWCWWFLEVNLIKLKLNK